MGASKVVWELGLGGDFTGSRVRVMEYNWGGLDGPRYVLEILHDGAWHSAQQLVAPGENKIETIALVADSLVLAIERMVASDVERRRDEVACAPAVRAYQDAGLVAVKAPYDDFDGLADVEGTPHEMLAIADALESLSHVEPGPRCACGPRLGLMQLWSPRNSRWPMTLTEVQAKDVAARIRECVAELAKDARATEPKDPTK